MAVPEVEVALDPGLVVVRALEVAAGRDPEGVGAVPGGAERPPEPRVRAVGDDDVAGPDRLGGAARGAQDGAAHQPAVDDGLECLGAGPQGGARLHRPVGDQAVEVTAADDVPVGRVVGMLGPGQLEGDPVGDGAQPLEAQVRGQLVGEAEVLELADGPRGERVAAGLVSGERLAVDDEHSVPGVGQPRGGGGPGRPGPHHEHVEPVANAHRGHRAIGPGSDRHRVRPDMPLPQLAW